MSRQKSKNSLPYARENMGMANQLYQDLKRYDLDVWLAPSRPRIRNRCCLGIDGRIKFGERLTKGIIP